MTEMGMEDWLIDAILEPFSSIRDGFGTKITTVVEQVTGIVQQCEKFIIRTFT